MTLDEVVPMVWARIDTALGVPTSDNRGRIAAEQITARHVNGVGCVDIAAVERDMLDYIAEGNK